MSILGTPVHDGRRIAAARCSMGESTIQHSGTPAPSPAAGDGGSAPLLALPAVRLVPFWSSVRQDVIAHVPPEYRDRSAWSWFLVTVRLALFSPGFRVTLLYRFNHSIS